MKVGNSSCSFQDSIFTTRVARRIACSKSAQCLEGVLSQKVNMVVPIGRLTLISLSWLPSWFPPPNSAETPKNLGCFCLLCFMGPDNMELRWNWQRVLSGFFSAWVTGLKHSRGTWTKVGENCLMTHTILYALVTHQTIKCVSMEQHSWTIACLVDGQYLPTLVCIHSPCVQSVNQAAFLDRNLAFFQKSGGAAFRNSQKAKMHGTHPCWQSLSQVPWKGAKHTPSQAPSTLI